MSFKFLAVNLLNIFFAAVETVLGLRFVLRLFGANANNGFVNWIYEMSGVLLEPFRGIFPTRVFENQFVFEFNTLFAMLMFAIVGMILIWLMAALAPEDSVAVKKVRR